MADRNQLKIERDYDFAESDPLAELTRIMGFDPRVEPAPPLDDDLGIDLERELMGEFEADAEFAASGEADGEAPAPEGEAAASEAAAPYEAEATVSADDVSLSADDLSASPDDLSIDDALARSFEEEFAASAEEWRPESSTDQDHDASSEARAYPVDDAAAADDDDALARSFEEELSASAEEWRPEISTERDYGASSEAGVYPAEQPAADEDDIDIDFSGQLSPADDDEALLAGERFLQETAAADEVPDLEAELGELLGALSAHHEVQADADHGNASTPVGIFQAEDASAASDEPEGAPQPERQAGEDDGAETPADSAWGPDGAADGDPDFHLASSDAMAEPIGDQVTSAEVEPRDEILDQLFQPAASEFSSDEVSEADDDGLSADDDGLSAKDSEIDFFLDAEDEPEDDLVAGAPESGDRDEGLAEAGAYEAAVEQDLFESGLEMEEPVFDDSDFESALADEFAAADFASQSADRAEIEEPREDPFAALSSIALPRAATTADADAASAKANGGAAEQISGDAEPSVAALPPEIETVEVPERAVALADDLDLPEVRFEDEAPRAVAYDDFEADFASAFDGLDQQDVDAEPAAAHHAEPNELDEDFDRLFEIEHAEPDDDQPAYGAMAPAAAPGYRAMEPTLADGYGGSGGDGALAYDPGYEGEMVESAETGDPASRKRGFVVAAVIAAVALVGSIGAFAYSWTGGESSAPVVVTADDEPVKVRPANPGGTVVPNQENKVYERVAEGALDAPSQEKLISGAEEPVEITAPAAAAQPTDSAADLPGVDLAPVDAAASGQPPSAKGEDRIEPSDIESLIANDEIAAVAPRRVRTMTVLPDGTLVPREEPEPAPAPVAEQPQAGSEASTLEQPGSPAPALAPMSSQPGEAVAEPAVVQETPAAEASPAVLAAGQPGAPASQDGQVEPRRAGASTPASVPVAPSRPRDEPVEIVGEVRTREKLAALSEPAPAEPAPGGWSMQIASQPSQEAAQSTYVNLASRYGSILGGRSFNIVKAEIAGKGTFWRVRIPAQSRADAVDLCERYRSAGGSCFVAQ